MKKLTRLFAVLLAVITLTLVSFAAEKNIDCKIFTAEQIIASKTTTESIRSRLIPAEGDEPAHVHVTSAVVSANEFFRFDLVKDNVEDKDYKPEFKFSSYPVILIKYRSNIQSNNGLLAMNASLLLSKTGKYERCWGLKGNFIGNEQWQNYIIDINTFDGYEGGNATGSDVSPSSGYRYIRIPAWAYSTGLNIRNEYFDIMFIGFFKSEEDAREYVGDTYVAKEYTVTVLDKDGKTVSSSKVVEDTFIELPVGPNVEYYDFAGWVNGSGEKISSFTVTSDITIKPTYTLNEMAYAKGQREKNINKALASGKKRTDKPFITGYDGFEFRPDNNMTRAEACTVITRLIVNEKTLDNKMSTSFTDLNKDAWYYKYVTYLESIGYLKSYKGEFKPDQNITRAEFVELVYNMGKISGGDKIVSFKDVPADHPRYAVIMAAAKAGLVNGKTADTFDPDGNIKRSEVVKVLCIALDRIPDKTSFLTVPVAGFCDVSERHWAYPYVLESAFEHECVTTEENIEIWLTAEDKNNYFLKAPDGLVEKLEATFEERKNEILATESEWTVAPGGKVWYVSYSEGENINDGLSPETPIKTIPKLERMQDALQINAGDVVLFKRGDEWHDKLVCKPGVTYSAYGEGAKPRILGSTEADKPAQWKETEHPGVYQYAYTLDKSKDVGNIVFNDGECYGMRILKDPNKTNMTLRAGDGDTVGNGITTWSFPVQSFSGYADIAKIAKENPTSDLMYYHDHENSKLYLYSREGNPGDRFESIELCTYGKTISAASNVTIDNLCVKFTGSHGIGAGSCENLTVRNCEIGWIGGSLQNPYDATSTTRYGNAVEIYGEADGFYVYNCYIYQCFDCGPTVQWQGVPTGAVVEKDVLFYDNVIRDASLEVWLSTSGQPTSTSYAKLENCRMFNNLVTGSGTGFKSGNHQKQEWCAFYGGPKTNAYYIDCYMENNYFWGNRRHLMKAVPTSALGFYGGANGFIWRGNVIVHPGDSGSIGYLGGDSAHASGNPVQYFYDKDTINSLVKNGTFAANKFYYTPGDASDKRFAGGMYS